MDFFAKMTPQEAQNLNALVLAYIGDAVESLFVREKLAREHDYKPNDLHKMATGIVNAHTQAMTAEALIESLTPEEKDIYLRGRNGKSHHKAKNQTGADYRKATGFEAVIGYLYLIGNVERIKELLK